MAGGCNRNVCGWLVRCRRTRHRMGDSFARGRRSSATVFGRAGRARRFYPCTVGVFGCAVDGVMCRAASLAVGQPADAIMARRPSMPCFNESSLGPKLNRTWPLNRLPRLARR